MTSRTGVVIAARSALADRLVRGFRGSAIDVLAVTADPSSLVDHIERRRPQVLLLDVELGPAVRDAAKAVMRRHPLPIIALVDDGQDLNAVMAELTALGVVDVVDVSAGERAVASLGKRIAVVSGVTVIRRPGRVPAASTRVRPRVVVIGASTGGPAALAAVLEGLAGLPVPIAVVQHMHVDFVEGFVTWLSQTSPLEVLLAQEGHTMLPGKVYVAAPGHHLRVRSDLSIEFATDAGELHCPSVDELFSSAARSFGPAAVGVLLTGMGADGAAGLRAMSDAGAMTMVQDEQSSAVYGMPQAALVLGAAQRVLALSDIAQAVRAAAARPA